MNVFEEDFDLETPNGKLYIMSLEFDRKFYSNHWTKVFCVHTFVFRPGMAMVMDVFNFCRRNVARDET